jgi:ATP-dependent Clp protease ATP-binding subunit ClpC
MANFDYINSGAYKTWRYRKNFAQTFIILTIVCVAFLVIAALLFFQGTPALVGFAQIILGLVLLLESYLLAARYMTSKPSLDNLADKLSLKSIELLDQIYKAAQQEGKLEITPDYFFEKVCLSPEGQSIFIRFGLALSEVVPVKQKVLKPTFSSDFTGLISSLAANPHQIEIADILEKVVANSVLIQKFLSDNKIDQKDFTIALNWIRKIDQESIIPRFWQKGFTVAGIGEEWSYGYTPVLSQYSTNLSRYFQDPNLAIDTFSHAQKINEIENVLAKPNKNNCLLVGEPGVGKKTIVNALAAKIAKGDCLSVLKYKNIRQINTARLLGGGSKSELAERVNNVLVEAVNAGNIILYIDNFQSLLGQANGGSEEVGGADVSQIFLQFFENSRLRIIASVTPADYFSRVRNNPSIAEAFEKIDIAPATPDDTLAIMLDWVWSLENRYNVFIPYQSLKNVVELSDRYVHDIPFPEKALRMVEEVAVSLGGKGKLKIIFPEDVDAFISKKVNVPIGQAQEGEKEKLLNLENLLHARVIGQNEAVNAVSDALRRVRAGLTNGKRPAGVFLFLGPTGVGKTETAKALAESYFGSEKNMIRLDMSEYQQPDSIDRLLGSQSNPSGVLTDAILANPFSLILLDEVEKADKNVLNVFLQVFEDGRLTDVRGRVSDFTNSIIIATSNAGSEFIRENVTNMAADELRENLVNTLQTQGSFTPEFLNRFDGVIVFHPLTVGELQKVATLMITDINNRLAEKKITVTVEPDALAKLVELGNDPQFGARPMRRVIQQKIENLLAKKMLDGTLNEGGTLDVTLADIV